MKAREEKTCEPSERGVLPSCPHHLPSSYLSFLFSVVLILRRKFWKGGEEGKRGGEG